MIRKDGQYEGGGRILGFDTERNYVMKDGVFYIHFPSTGEWRPASKETMKEFGIAETQAQVDARNASLDELVLEMKRREANMTAEERAERIAEARAAHGPGVKLVNVFTGRTFTT